MVSDAKKRELEDWIENELEELSFEDILEKFDLTAAEVFLILFDSGLIDEELIRNRVS